MPDRFFHPDDLSASEVTLTGTEAHHLIHVLRAQVGTVIELFDGQGISVQGDVAKVLRKEAVIHLKDPQCQQPQPGPTLVTAVPKGDRFRWLVEKATELGVTRLIPVSTQRSVVNPRETRLKKMEQTVIAACKQSGRNSLMSISEPISLPEALAAVPDSSKVVVAHPTGQPFGQVERARQSECHFVVGPEGGLTEEELESLIALGAATVSLGNTILRTETAGIALVSWWRLS